MGIITPQDRGLKFLKRPVDGPYVHQNYPSVRYHRDGRSIVVQDEEADRELGEDWAANPFPAKPKVSAPAPITSSQLQAHILQLNEKFEDLKGYLNEKTAENLELRMELAKLKAHPQPRVVAEPEPEPGPEPEPVSESGQADPPADEPHKGGKKKREK